MKVEELAELAHMSVSSFHHHFKSVTSMSPLQFQKVLRLQEARRLKIIYPVGIALISVMVLVAAGSRSYKHFSPGFLCRSGFQPRHALLPGLRLPDNCPATQSVHRWEAFVYSRKCRTLGVPRQSRRFSLLISAHPETPDGN